MTPPILYEDNHLLAVNKMPGTLVQGDKTGDACITDLMKAFIKKRDSKPGNVFLGLPHRLDRPTSGVLVLAKTSKALSRLTESFRNRDTKKIYWAIVESPPKNPEGELIHWLRKDVRTNTARSTTPGTPGAKEAHLRYRQVASVRGFHLIEVELLTGRHHQIRAQLSLLGCPVAGDRKYGGKKLNFNGNIYLHSRTLDFPHPTRRERVVVTAPPPDDSLWDEF